MLITDHSYTEKYDGTMVNAAVMHTHNCNLIT